VRIENLLTVTLPLTCVIMKLMTVMITNARDFNITIVKATHYHLSGVSIDFKISDISI
jgi:hypothetical protein